MGKLILNQTLEGHQGRVWSVKWHPKGNILASCGEDKSIRLWGKEGNRWVTKTILTGGHERTIRDIAWSPNGALLASASFDATIAIWDKNSGVYECNATLEGHESEVKSVAWSKSGNLLSSCSRDKSVWVWEVSEDDEYDCGGVLNAHTQDVKKVLWHPHKDILASTSYDNTIKLFKEDPDDNDWTCFATLSSHESTVWSLNFDKTGTRLATCSDDKTVKIWQEYLPGNNQEIATPNNLPVWKCVCTLSGYHKRPIYDISWSSLNDLIATACGDDTIRIFKESFGSDPNEPSFLLDVCEYRAHLQDINAIQWNPVDQSLLATASDDGEIKIWNYVE